MVPSDGHVRLSSDRCGLHGNRPSRISPVMLGQRAAEVASDVRSAAAEVASDVRSAGC